MDEAENEEIHEMIGEDTEGGFWVGGQEADGVDNEWEWSNGDPWDYKNFGKGEPNNNAKSTNAEGCIQLNRHTGKKTWNDADCADKRWYICKVGADGQRRNRFERRSDREFTEKIALIETREEEEVDTWVNSTEKEYTLRNVKCECRRLRNGRRLSTSVDSGSVEGDMPFRGRALKRKKHKKGKKGKKGHSHGKHKKKKCKKHKKGKKGKKGRGGRSRSGSCGSPSPPRPRSGSSTTIIIINEKDVTNRNTQWKYDSCSCSDANAQVRQSGISRG